MTSSVQALLPLILILVVGYLLFIRPVRRRANAQAALQASLVPGDEVMLSSGIFARLVEMRDEVAQLEVASGTVIRCHRNAITQVIRDRPSPFEDRPAETAPTEPAEDA